MVTENHPPSPSKKTTTKWMVACIIGMAVAAVVSSALLFVSIMDFSKQASTHESFLLHRKDGTCVAQSGAWTPGTRSVDDDSPDDDYTLGPYSTCYAFQGGVAQNDYC